MHEMTSRSVIAEPAQTVVNASFARRTLAAIGDSWSRRQSRPWLALIAVPLAMNVSGMMQLWWLWTPLLVGAAACTRPWRWSLALSFQLGVFGTEWAYVGATALAMWPAQRQFVGLIWASVALCLSGAAHFHRLNHNIRL
jgi:hypothetical protein